MSTDIAMGAAFDHAVADLENLIARRFAARTIRMEECPDGRWVAMTGDDRMLFPPAAEDVVERFVRAFARKEGYRVEPVVRAEHSVRAPDNVVSILGRVEA